MASLTLSSPSGFANGSAQTSGPFVGHMSSANHVLRYSFKTPADGYINSLTFATTFRHFMGDAGATYYVRVKVTESATSHVNAGSGTSDYNGTISVSGTADLGRSCTITGLWLKPNTTYYLFLFPGSQNFAKYCYNNSGADLSSLSYNSIVATYTLKISAGAGASVAVRRTESPSGLTGEISDGATIYDGDVLVPTITLSNGYYIYSTTHINNGAFRIRGNVTITVITAVLFYLLSLTEGTGSTITVRRTSSPLAGAALGVLSDGEPVYHSDVLQITTSANAGYEIKQQTVNGSAFSSGVSYNVSSNVTIVTVTGVLGIIYIDTGSSLERFLIYIDNGSSWDQYVPYVDNGSGWSTCH